MCLFDVAEAVEPENNEDYGKESENVLKLKHNAALALSYLANADSEKS